MLQFSKSSNGFFLKIESFFAPKSIEIDDILCIVSVDYNVDEVK